jgi:Primase C terminal 2 (PriCT-2)
LAIHAATNGSYEGYAIFNEWSQKWPEYNAEDTRRTWASLKPKQIGDDRSVAVQNFMAVARRAAQTTVQREGNNVAKIAKKKAGARQR